MINCYQLLMKILSRRRFNTDFTKKFICQGIAMILILTTNIIFNNEPTGWAFWFVNAFFTIASIVVYIKITDQPLFITITIEQVKYGNEDWCKSRKVLETYEFPNARKFFENSPHLHDLKSKKSAYWLYSTTDPTRGDINMSILIKAKIGEVRNPDSYALSYWMFDYMWIPDSIIKHGFIVTDDYRNA